MTTKLTKKQMKEMEMTKAQEQLKEILEKHDYQVKTRLNHVSQSGMLRAISVLVENETYYKDITDLVATALDEKIHNKGGIKMTGCGMDMGFALVYNLSMKLYCPEKYDHDSAYKLKQRWI